MVRYFFMNYHKLFVFLFYNIILCYSLQEIIFQAYCQHRCFESSELKRIIFRFDGIRVQPDHTPEMLELQDNDQIDVMIEVVGC